MPDGLNKSPMTKHFTFFLFTLTALCYFSCKEKKVSATAPVLSENKTEVHTPLPSQKQDTLKTGVTTKVTCLAFASESYAVYLPASYSKSKALPVIYFFDPHADGSLPLENYKSLAEEFHFVFVGCNNSKNGMSFEQTQAVAGRMMADVTNRFYVHEQWQYVAGFSGGSKVACNLAIVNPSIKGLIACSGSYANNAQPFSASLNVASLAGEKDFNYFEMVRFHEIVSVTNAALFISTNNKHEWPPVTAMREALLFMHIKKVEGDKKSDEVKALETAFKKEMAKASALEKKGNIYNACQQYKNSISIFKNTLDVSLSIEKVKSLEKNPLFEAYENKKQNLENQEQKAQQYYAEAFQTKDINWWNNDIAKTKTASEDSSDPLWAAYNSRMMGFFGIISYSYCTQAVKANAAQAEKLLAIYKSCAPEIDEANFLSAVYAANNGKTDVAITELKAAIQKGFHDKSRIISYPALSAIVSNSSELKMLLDAIH